MTQSRSNEVRPFVILFQVRSGSTYLIEALNSHPHIFAEGEKLKGRKVWPPPTSKSGLSENGAHLQHQGIFEFFTQPPQGISAIGFKTKLVDLVDRKDFAKLLKKLRVYIIQLDRCNLVKQLVSWFNAERLSEATGDWNLYNEKDRLPPFTIDVDLFLSRFQMMEKARRILIDYVMSLELPTLSLYYEDLLMDKQTTINQALSFLGVNSEPVEGKTTFVELSRTSTSFGPNSLVPSTSRCLMRF
jgi:LPS sulfotransferase NodH